MSKKKIMAILFASIMTMGLLSACGNTADTQATNENTQEVVVEVETEETEAEEAESEEAESEEVTETVVEIEETSIEDADCTGFYCSTRSEQIEDYEVTTTYGYLLREDGTGVSYGQDVVDFSWDESGIHFADSTRAFAVKDGELTVGAVIYNKIDGNFIAPMPVHVDINNLDNGMYYAGIDKSGIHETDAGLNVVAEIYTEESYDIVDINRMAEGDVIYINGQLFPVTSIDKLDSGIININGGIENMGSAVRAEEESNCYFYVGMDMEKSYTYHGIAEIALSENAKLIDHSDTDGIKEYTGSEVIPALKALVEEYSLSCHDCLITVEDGEIIEIYRMFRP